MEEKNISRDDIYETLKNYRIIEFHRKETDYHTDDRLVIRSRNMIKYRNICLCISLRTGRIITAYSNSYKDKHKTINMDYYNSNIDIRNYIEDNKIHSEVSSFMINNISKVYV